MKHTPGPWQVWPTHWAGGNASHQYHGHNTIWIDSPNGEVAMVRPDVGGQVTAATYANARLIAAAPEMFDALEECAVFLSRLNGKVSLEVWKSIYEPLRQAREALAKARGAE